MVDCFLTQAGDPRRDKRKLKFEYPGVCDVVIRPGADRSAIRLALYDMLRLLEG